MFETNSRTGPVTPTAIIIAVALHLLLVLVIWGVGLFKPDAEVTIPMDLTIVPPWAQQTDDPDPDPNPPPQPQPKVEQPKPQPKPEEPKVDKNLKAVEQEVEKPKPKKPEKPKEKPKPEDLRKNATFVKEDKPPERRNLREESAFVKPIVQPQPTPRTGKGTAADKPLSKEEYEKLLNLGYKPGARNQIADNETSRCMGLITAAVRRECERDSFKWHQGMQDILLEISFGPGGRVVGYRILTGSGDAAMDQLVLRAVSRLGSVAGLSAPFLQEHSTVGVRIDPLQR